MGPVERRQGEEGGATVAEREEQRADPPKRCDVFVLNDDYSMPEQVVWVLRQVFGMGAERASAVMLTAHRSGRGLCETTSLEIAETRCEQVREYAEAIEIPLRAEAVLREED